MKKLIVAGLITLIGIVYTLGFYSGWNLDKADIVHADSLVYDCPGYDDLIQTCDSEIGEGIRMRKEIDSLKDIIESTTKLIGKKELDSCIKWWIQIYYKNEKHIDVTY